MDHHHGPGCDRSHALALSWRSLDRAATTLDHLIAGATGAPRVVVQKANNPLDPDDHTEAIRALLRQILAIITPIEERAENQLLRTLSSINWPSLNEEQRDRAIAQAMGVISGLGRVLPPRIGTVLDARGRLHVTATKAALQDQYALAIDPTFNAVDRKVLAHLVSSQALYIRNEYGRREASYSNLARRIAAAGVEKGLDRRDIGEAMHKAFKGTSAERSEGYFRMAASVFMGRARSYATCVGFTEAQIEYSEWSSVRDKNTCFAAGTPVLMADGTTRPIESIRVGDMVVSCKGSARRVRRTFRTDKRDWLRLTFTDGRVVEVTSEHPMLTSAGWEQAGRLVVGSKVAMFTGSERLRSLWEVAGEEGRNASGAESLLFGGVQDDRGRLRGLWGKDRPPTRQGIRQVRPQDLLQGVLPPVHRAPWQEASPLRDVRGAGLYSVTDLLFGGMLDSRSGVRALRGRVPGASLLRASQSGELLFREVPPGASAERLLQRGTRPLVRSVWQGDPRYSSEPEAWYRPTTLLERVPHQGDDSTLQDVRKAGVCEAIAEASAVLLPPVLSDAHGRDGLGGDRADGTHPASGAVQARGGYRPLDGGLLGRRPVGDRGGRGLLACFAEGEAAGRAPGRAVGCDGIHGRSSRREGRERGPGVHRASLEGLRPTPARDLALVGDFVAVAAIERYEITRPAFDLQIEEEPGYIATGLVVHNCDPCLLMDGEVFPVSEQIRSFNDVAASPDPEEVRFRQPFMSKGKDDDGEYLYYKDRDGSRVEIARVVESGVGRGEKGTYRGAMGAAALAAKGMSAPPAHPHCLCLLVPAGLETVQEARSAVRAGRATEVPRPAKEPSAKAPASEGPAPEVAPPNVAPAPGERRRRELERLPVRNGTFVVPLSLLDDAPYSNFIEGRTESIRRALDQGTRLPPMRIVVNSLGRLQIADGNHRLRVYRERGVSPVEVEFVVQRTPGSWAYREEYARRRAAASAGGGTGAPPRRRGTTATATPDAAKPAAPTKPPKAPAPLISPPPKPRVPIELATGSWAEHVRQHGIPVRDPAELDAGLKNVFGDKMPTLRTLEKTWSSVESGHEIKIDSLYVNKSDNSVVLNGQVWKDGKSIGNITRSFIRHRDGTMEVHHDFYKIDDNKHQGKGAGEAMLRQAIQTYERLGYQKITVDTAWVGKYAWATFGYNWKESWAGNVRDRLVPFLEKHGIEPERAARVAKGVVKRAWDVAALDLDGKRVTLESEGKKIDCHLGKAFLLSTYGWSGDLVLDPKHPTYKRAKERLKL